MTETYSFEILAELQKARQSVDKFSDKTQEQLDSLNLKAMVSSVQDGFSIVERFARPVIQFLQDAVQESLEAEKANKALGNAMRIVGDFTAEAQQELTAYADQLARTTELTDDQITSGLALAKSYNLTNSEAKELIKVATDLSALTGDSLNSSVEKLAKTYNGFVSRELKQLRPELRGLTEEQLANGEAVRILGEYVAGTAARMNTGFGGAMNRATKANNEFKEALGDSITKAKENQAIINAYAATVEFLTGHMDAMVNSLKNAVAGMLGLAPAKAGIELLAFAFGKLRGETELVLDNIEQIRLKSAQDFAAKQAEERVKRERVAQVAAEKAITEFNAIRLDLEKQGLTQIEAINKEAQRRIKIVREAAAAGQPEAVRRQEEYIANIRIDAAKRVARVQAELDKKVLENREQLKELVKDQLEGIANKPLSGLITFAIKGQEELDKTRAKISQQIKDIQASDIAPATKKQLIQTANTVLAELEKGAKQALAVGIASSVLSAVKKGAAGAAEAVAGVVGGIVEAYLPGFGKLAQQLIEFLSLGPDEVKRLVTEFEMAVPQVVENILTAIPALIEQVIKNAPKVIQKIIDMLPRVIIALIKGIPQIIQAFVQSIPEIIQAFIKGIPQIIAELVKAAPDIAKAIIDAIFSLAKGDAIPGGGVFGGGGGGGLGGIVGDIVGGVGDVIGGIGDLFGVTSAPAPRGQGDSPQVGGNGGREIIVEQPLEVKMNDEVFARTQLRVRLAGFRT